MLKLCEKGWYKVPLSVFIFCALALHAAHVVLVLWVGFERGAWIGFWAAAHCAVGWEKWGFAACASRQFGILTAKNVLKTRLPLKFL
jgi:hypothetical protein